jgi:NADPH2:quinone reductase
MRAAAIDRFGGPDVLTLHSLPVPAPSPKEVLIALDTAGVGGWDSDIRGGWYPFGHPKFPLVLGTDGAGVIAAVGSRVRRFSRGDRVYSYEFNNSKGGFYAEYVAVAQEKVGRVPRGLDLRKAGAIATTGLTALQGIDDALRVRKGETVLVHGATGGVGSLAVQFARWRGARVLATATGRDGVGLARRLGAAAAIDGKRADIAKALKRLAPEGVDAVLALAGGKAVAQCVNAVRRGGRVAYPNGVEPAPRKRKGIRSVGYDAVTGRRELDRLSRAVLGARVRVVIAKSFPLSAAAHAHRRLERGHVLGKIVLRTRGRRVV